jgi:hypothetical protein
MHMPDAEDARSAQGKIYEWELMISKPSYCQIWCLEKST